MPLHLHIIRPMIPNKISPAAALHLATLNAVRYKLNYLLVLILLWTLPPVEHAELAYLWQHTTHPLLAAFCHDAQDACFS